jgi:hypothetical protein
MVGVACGSNHQTSTAVKATAGQQAAVAHITHAAAPSTSSDATKLYTTMRQLWSDHMQYTVMTVDAFFHNNDALQPRLNRLLQNQKDIGAAIVPYFGQDAGNKLTDLLTTHINQAVPVLTAAKNGDQAALKKASDDWYANAKQIADFLSAANPENWPTSATEPMMKTHIDQTTTYAVDLLKGNYAQAVTDYDKAFDHMMEMADTLSKGIIAKFPDKVGGSAAANQAQIALYDTMRQLWTDHMQYTVMTVDSFFHNNDALQPRLNRLLQNQKDLGAAIVPYFGQDAGNKLTDLLTTHIKQAVPVLTAAKSGDQAALKKASDDWYANAKEIADFLSAANPENWPTSATEPMMKTHIDQTTTYSVDLLKGDYAKAITDYDAAFSHMMEMADTLSQGVIAKFPDKVAASETSRDLPRTE